MCIKPPPHHPLPCVLEIIHKGVKKGREPPSSKKKLVFKFHEKKLKLKNKKRKNKIFVKIYPIFLRKLRLKISFKHTPSHPTFLLPCCLQFVVHTGEGVREINIQFFSILKIYF